MDKSMTSEQLNQLGLLIDKCDSFLETIKLRLPPEMTIDSLMTGLKEVRNELFDIYKGNGGDLEIEPLDFFE